TVHIAAAPLERVRLRLINAANARVFDLRFTDFQAVQWIGSDGSYLEAPVNQTHFVFGPGERFVVDVVPGAQPGLIKALTFDVVASVEPSGAPKPTGLLPAPDGPHARARAEHRASVLAAAPVADLDWVINVTGDIPFADLGLAGPEASRNA